MTRSVIIRGIPDSECERVVEALDSCECIDHVDVFQGTRRKGGDSINLFKLEFKVRGAYLARVLKLLQNVGVPQSCGEIDILEVRCTSEELPKITRSTRTEKGSICPSALDRMSTLEINNSIVDGSHINFDHVLLVVLASGIAAVGLLSDSDAFVLASFFISPLMQMIMAVTWGLCIKGE
jgi:hypothetical protein